MDTILTCVSLWLIYTHIIVDSAKQRVELELRDLATYYSRTSDYENHVHDVMVCLPCSTCSKWREFSNYRKPSERRRCNL